MRLFQHEWGDSTISIVAAENKEEACELLEEFGSDIDEKDIIPLRNFMVTLFPNYKQGKVCWDIDDMGINTALELPMLEQKPETQKKDCDIIQLSNFLNGE